MAFSAFWAGFDEKWDLVLVLGVGFNFPEHNGQGFVFLDFVDIIGFFLRSLTKEVIGVNNLGFWGFALGEIQPRDNWRKEDGN